MKTRLSGEFADRTATMVVFIIIIIVGVWVYYSRHLQQQLPEKINNSPLSRPVTPVSTQLPPYHIPSLQKYTSGNFILYSDVSAKDAIRYIKIMEGFRNYFSRQFVPLDSPKPITLYLFSKTEDYNNAPCDTQFGATMNIRIRL